MASRRARRATARSQPIAVEGLGEFARELRKLGRDDPRELNRVNFEVVDRTVVPAAQRIAAREGRGPARAADTLRAAKQARRAVVKLGKASVPDALGWEFGSIRYPQFRPWRGNQHVPWADSGPGYFLYPAIRDSREEIIDAYRDAIGRLAADAFPD